MIKHEEIEGFRADRLPSLMELRRYRLFEKMIILQCSGTNLLEIIMLLYDVMLKKMLALIYYKEEII